jgi:WhiB family redox-sensing transcriptional regulator
VSGVDATPELLRATLPEPVPYDGEPAAWLGRAACAGMDVDLFFGRQVAAAARAVCLACPVRAECLGMALAFPSDWAAGYWGGTSQQDRRRLRRERRTGSNGFQRNDLETANPKPVPDLRTKPL